MVYDSYNYLYATTKFINMEDTYLEKQDQKQDQNDFKFS